MCQASRWHEESGRSWRWALLGLLALSTLAPARAESFPTEAWETWIAAPNGNLLYVRGVQPAAATTAGRRFPALVAIPGGIGSGAPYLGQPRFTSLAASGFVVVGFNPEGRGSGAPGNRRSEGVEACNGAVHQDDLAAVVRFVAGLGNVDASNLGIETSSFGIAIGAGAVGRYPELPVAYLIDHEGPHDSRVIAFYDVGQERAVCGHLSTVTDPSPANLAFWVEREAVRSIGGFAGIYVRLQAEIDHAQGAGFFRHAVEMIAAATRPLFGGAGRARWTRMNLADLANPMNTLWSEANPPTWVTGRLADHPEIGNAAVLELAAFVATSPQPRPRRRGL